MQFAKREGREGERETEQKLEFSGEGI